MSPMAKTLSTIKTRICIISDTHTRKPFPASDTIHPFRSPLPTADILIHAGDLTGEGHPAQYAATLELLEEANAELKLVIPGNHDTSLDTEFYAATIKEGRRHRGIPYNVDEIREMWTGDEAKAAGIVYMDEGVHTFELKNGAKFTVYASPYTPEFCRWAFAYPRNEDRFNPPTPLSAFRAPNPIPSWPAIDIIVTHGPPRRILDLVLNKKEHTGCDALLEAVKRCRPRLHCFGHIHEAYGAERRDWETNATERIEMDLEKAVEDRGIFLDISRSAERPLGFGKETLFVNAAIMNRRMRPDNAPWVVDLELPLKE